MYLEYHYSHAHDQLPTRSRDLETLETALMLVWTPLACGICWGIAASLAFECIPLLVRRARGAQDTKNRRWLWFYVAYVAVMLCLGTLCVICYAIPPQLYLAGLANGAQPWALESAYPHSASAILINVSNWIATSMADALMVWRCCVLHQCHASFKCIKSGLGSLFLITTASGFLCMIAYSLPNNYTVLTTAPWLAAVSRWYFFMATILNLAATSLIVIRLRSERTSISTMMGSTFNVDARLNYTGISAMMIESCTLITICSISYLILPFIDSPFRTVVIAMVDEVQIIAPLLVILRIARGVAWTNESRDSLPDLEIA
ncbi:hypothetical protein CONPUDRAFT_161998, partial [Coniophora puteana RWD-64-598 SS2]